jgi:hypothetical protein
MCLHVECYLRYNIADNKYCNVCIYVLILPVNDYEFWPREADIGTGDMTHDRNLAHD